MTTELNTKVVTGKVRFSFVNVFEARAFGENNDPKYSVMLLIPKTDVGTIDRCKKAIDVAAQRGLTTKFGGKLPPILKTTFKDADKDTDQDGEIFKNKWDYTALYKYTTTDCRCKQKPNNKSSRIIQRLFW